MLASTFSVAVKPLPVMLIVGASLTALTLALRLTASDQPLGEPVSSVLPVPATNAVPSDRRTVSAPGMPLKLATLGRKRIWALVPSTTALLSLNPEVGTSLQLAPLSVLYCHWPWVNASALLPVMASPASVYWAPVSASVKCPLNKLLTRLPNGAAWLPEFGLG